MRPRQLAQILSDAVAWWIQPAGKTVEDTLDLIVLEQFTQKWVKRHEPGSMAEALKLAGDYMAAEVDIEPVKRERVGNAGPSNRLGNKNRGMKSESWKPGVQENKCWEPKEVTCFRCGEKGHIA